ncbi:MAG: hypothetical protein PW788_11110 [Micavibrio sp.]|nr:hypothetical protein [Micavibrio sp.]
MKKLTRGDIENLICDIAEKCYQKHVLEAGEFFDATLGPPKLLQTIADFEDEIRRTLFDRNTRVLDFPGKMRQVYYNDFSNTLVILTPEDGKIGTCYRPYIDSQEDPAGPKPRLCTNFKRIEAEYEGITGKPPPPRRGGVFELNPDMERGPAPAKKLRNNVRNGNQS